MAFSILWSIDDLEEENDEPLFQLSQESMTASLDPRIKIDYLGESLQCQLLVDRYFTTASPAMQVYSSIDPHLLGVLQGSSCTAFVRLGQRPPQMPLGVLFGETPMWGSEGSHENICPTDGVAIRIIKKLFAEMQNEVRNGADAFSVRMGFTCFMKSPTQPTDLLKNIKQHVPAELEWGDVEGIMPGKYIYVTSVSDVMRTITKLLASGSFSKVTHRLSYCMHFLVLKTPAGMPPSAASTAKVAHLIFSDIHPDHTQAAQSALAPALTKLRKDKEASSFEKEKSIFNGVPLSPRGAPPSPGLPRDTNDILAKCFGLLKTMSSSRVVVLAAAKASGPLTPQQQVQLDTMVNVLQATQKAGPVSAKFKTNLNSIFAPTTSDSPPDFSPPGMDEEETQAGSVQPVAAPGLADQSYLSFSAAQDNRHVTNHPQIAPTRHAEPAPIRHVEPAPTRHVEPAPPSRPPFEKQHSQPPSPHQQGRVPRHSPPRPQSAELKDIAGELEQMHRELSPPSPETRPDLGRMLTPASRVAEESHLSRLNGSMSELGGHHMGSGLAGAGTPMMGTPLQQTLQSHHTFSPSQPPQQPAVSRSEVLLKNVRIHELETQVAQLEAKIVQVSGSRSDAWINKVEAETSKRDSEALKLELAAERKRAAAESAALQERIITLEATHKQKIHEVQAMLVQQGAGDDVELAMQRRELQSKIIESDQNVMRAEQQKEDALMRSRALGAASEDMKTQIAGMRATIVELEARLQSEAMARDTSDKDIDRLHEFNQSTQEQLSALKKANADAEMEVRVTRSELEALRSEATAVSMELETQKATTRRLRLHLGGMGGVERDRVEEREATDRARIWADFIEGLHWLAHTCNRWSHLQNSSKVSNYGSTSSLTPLNRMEDLQTLRERLSQRDSQLYAKTSEALALEQELAEIKVQFRDYQKEVERKNLMHEEQVRLVESENSELQRQRGTHGTELKRATDLAQSNEMERNEATDALRKVKAEHAAMKETVEEVTRQRSVAMMESETLRRKLSQMESKSDKEVVRLSAELRQRETQLTEARKQVSTLQQVSDSHQQCERMKRALEAQLNEHQMKMKNLRRQVDDLDMQLLEQTTKTRETDENAKRAEALLKEQVKYVEGVKADRDRLEAERKSGQDWVQSVQEEIRGKTHTLDGIEKLLKDEQAKEVEREKEIAALKEQLGQSRDEFFLLQQKVLKHDEEAVSRQMSPAVTPSLPRSRAESVAMSPVVKVEEKDETAKLREQLVNVERENSRLKQQREEELAKARPPPVSHIPHPTIATRAEQQLAQMNNDLAKMASLPLPTPFPRATPQPHDLSRSGSIPSQPRSHTLLSPHTLSHPSPSPAYPASFSLENGRLRGATPPRHPMY